MHAPRRRASFPRITSVLLEMRSKLVMVNAARRHGSWRTGTLEMNRHPERVGDGGGRAGGSPW